MGDCVARGVVKCISVRSYYGLTQTEFLTNFHRGVALSGYLRNCTYSVRLLFKVKGVCRPVGV